MASTSAQSSHRVRLMFFSWSPVLPRLPRLRLLWQSIFMQPAEIPMFFHINDYSYQRLTDACNVILRDPKSPNCTIHSIEHYKETKSPMHELLLVRISIPRGYVTETRYIVVQRSVDDTNMKHHVNASHGPPIPATDSITFFPWSSKEKVLPAEASLLQTIVFPYPPPLIDFTRLIALIPSIAPAYNLLSKQCFWLCKTIIKSCCELWPTDRIPTSEINKAGKSVGILSSSALGQGEEDSSTLVARYRGLPPFSRQGDVKTLQEALDLQAALTQKERDARIKQEEETQKEREAKMKERDARIKQEEETRKEREARKQAEHDAAAAIAKLKSLEDQLGTQKSDK